MREWDIPFDELKIGEPIGTGRFGTVYRGNWHGDVAIKVLNMDYLDDEKTLEAFKLEVGVSISYNSEDFFMRSVLPYIFASYGSRI
jgi:serine/threonine protein kinase